MNALSTGESRVAEKQPYKPKVRWDQSAYKKMRVTWSPERKAEDGKLLRKIFRMAAASPLLAEEIKWARAHGIKFFIDRTAVNCGGYYTPGAGVVAIAAKYASPETMEDFAFEVMGHEIRHAWQDYHGYIGIKRNILISEFSRELLQVALYEADAKAYGRLVGRQMNLAFRKQAIKEIEAAEAKEPPLKSPRERENRQRIREVVRMRRRESLEFEEQSLRDTNGILIAEFKKWFETSSVYYGDACSKRLGRAWGVYAGDLPRRNFEFQAYVSRFTPGIDVDDMQSVLRLGRSFSGTGNYLAKMSPDILLKQILRPSLADTFWGAANDDQKKLTTVLRKAFLKASRVTVRDDSGKLKVVSFRRCRPLP